MKVRQFLVRLLSVLLMVSLGIVLAWKLVMRSHHLSFVPDALGVDDIDYVEEQSWGIPLLGLPGDNETGIIVYELPGDAAETLAKEGLHYLQNLPANPRSRGRDWRGSYNRWQTTPFDDAARVRMTWAYTDIPRDCGFCIRIDPGVWAEVKRIVSAPGSYYAFGRIGVIVVSPRQRKVVYMYNG